MKPWNETSQAVYTKLLMIILGRGISTKGLLKKTPNQSNVSHHSQIMIMSLVRVPYPGRDRDTLGDPLVLKAPHLKKDRKKSFEYCTQKSNSVDIILYFSINVLAYKGLVEAIASLGKWADRCNEISC